MQMHDGGTPSTVDDVIAADAEARRTAHQVLQEMADGTR
jgi:hypothetical protein